MGGSLSLFTAEPKLQNGNEKNKNEFGAKGCKIGKSRNICISEGAFKQPGTNTGRFSR